MTWPLNHDMPHAAYIYKAYCVGVVDGDTIDVYIDQGFHTYRRERLRLLGVNTPEMKGATLQAGRNARQYTIDWLATGGTGPTYMPVAGKWPLIIFTEKADAFGRYLATVWRTKDGVCLNNDLISSGHAVEDIR